MKKTMFILLSVFAALVTAHTTARAAQSDLPSQAYISGFVGRAQQYSLSCESRSAVDVAAFWGYSISETEFFNNLPSSDDPNQGFVGNVNDPWGYIPPASYGVHAEPIARLMRSYGLDARAEEGLSWQDLQNEIAAGRPVIVWVIGSVWSGTQRFYTTQAGSTVLVANNQHTMTLIGYDQNAVQLVDALTGYTITHSIQNFMASWGVLNNMAVLTDGPPQTQPEAEPPTSQQPSGESYTVQAGDTLNRIAGRLGFTWVDLAAWNNITYPYTLFPGQALALYPSQPEAGPQPSADSYTVQRGDHLMKIARELELNWQDLAALNDLAAPYLIMPGQVLRLPASQTAALPPNEPVEAPEFYTATRSESLFALAHYYGLDWLQLAALNNINFPFMLAPGQTVTLQH